MKEKTDNLGFTMVELFLVMAFIGICSMIIAPNLLKFVASSRLNGAARQVAGDLMGARMEAVKQNCKTILEFENDHEYYIVFDKNGNNVHDDDELKLIKDIHDNYHDVFNNKVDTKNIFNPRGAANRMRNIELRNSSGMKTIKVSISGRIKIE